jgi:carboxyl-terminal processing protease
MTSLFVPRGPVVQLRDTSGRVEVLEEQASEAIYSGPMAVLVNRFSASASEIFAAAIQDYGRGLVIGQQTYGKGTVQNLYPLDRYAPGSDPRFGQLTLTIGKYYRVTGASTQHRGVVPDIEVPSPVDAELVGESTRETALPWDQIQPTRFTPEGSMDEAIQLVSSRHEQRAAVDPNFDFLRSDIRAVEDRRNRKSVSLNIDVRREENRRFEQESLTRENERRSSLGLEPVDSLEELDADEGPDVTLREAAEIVTDLASMPAAAIARSREPAEPRSE